MEIHLHATRVQEDINALKEAIKKMNTIHQEAFLATTGPKEAKLSQELNNVIQETNPKAARAKASLNVSKQGKASMHMWPILPLPMFSSVIF